MNSDDITRREVVLHHLNQIRNHCSVIPNSREKSLVLTKLEEAELWLGRVTAEEADQAAFGPTNVTFSPLVGGRSELPPYPSEPYPNGR